MSEAVYDGLVSRHLNRRVSRLIARLLARTPATPNQVSIASLGLAVACFGCFVSGYYVAGALLAQASSIADDLARLKNMTSAFGGFMDAILDRYADSLILLGLTIWAAGDSDTYVWVVGFWALAGTFTVTYTRARITAPSARPFDRGITSAASRDVRLLIVMVGGLLGQGAGNTRGHGCSHQYCCASAPAARPPDIEVAIYRDAQSHHRKQHKS